MSSILKQNAREVLTDDSKTDTIGKIIDRKEEQEELDSDVFNPIKEGDVGVSTTYIYGGSGTGKTYTVNMKVAEVEEEVEDPLSLEAIYINGRKYTTYHKFLVKLLDQLSHRLPVKINGKSIEKVPASGRSVSFLYDLLKELVEQHECRLLVTLDEIDKINKDGAQQIISMFWDMKSQGFDVQLISISNDPIMLESLDGDIDRRIGNKIHFPHYNAVQLTEILQEFAELTLKEGSYEKEELVYIAKEVATTSGSASEAKKLLYHTAKRSEDHLDSDLMDEAQDKVEKQMLRDEVFSKPLHHQLSLLAVAKCQLDYEQAQRRGSTNHAEKDAPTTKKIYNRYSEICRKFDIEAKSRRTLIRSLNTLEKDDMISTNLEGLGRGKGVSKLHRLMYDSAIMEELLLESLEDDIYLGEEEIQKVKI